MKLVLLLPGYLDSPNYFHFKFFTTRLEKLGYTVERPDFCRLWETGNTKNYNTTNFLKDIKYTIDSYKDKKPTEIVLIGHSFGGFMAIIAGNKFKEVTKVIGLCPAVYFAESNDNWDKTGNRYSTRDFPDDSEKIREFNVPFSFVQDREKYSVDKALEELNKPLMVMISMKDTTVLPEWIEKALKKSKNPYIIRMENMGHSFRRSEADTNLVTAEIEKYLKL